MASSQRHSLPLDVQENIIQNIQKRFSIYIDKKMIRDVLNRESWDLEKSMAFLQKGLHTFNENPNNARKKENKTKYSNHVKPHLHKNKPGTNNTTPGLKAPELIKNFKKKTRSKKIKQNEQNKDSIVPGNRVIVNENNSQLATTDTPTVLNIELSAEKRTQSNESRLAKKKQMIQHYDLIKQFREPLDRITAYMNGGMKVMILLRGCSGSGKTTYAKQILKKHGAKYFEAHIFSADNFFTNKEGNYAFNFDILPLAHEWNQKLVRLAACEGRSPIFVDNTNTRLWEMKEYASVAVEFGYIVETLEPPTPWFFHEDVLVRKTVHNVPRDTIKKMLDRYEANVSGADILNALKLKYGSVMPPQVVTAGLDAPTSKKYNKKYNERLSIELATKTSQNPSTKNSDSPLPQLWGKQTKQVEKTEVPLRPLRSRQKDHAMFQPPKQQQYNQIPVNSNPIGITRPHLLPFPGTNFATSSSFVGPPVPNQQQMCYPQTNLYNQNNRPFMTAAVPNVFNQQFNVDFSAPMYHRADMVNPFFNRPQEENVGNKPMTEKKPSYVDDLIDLTFPTNVESSKENPIEMSSSISLLEGFRIESETDQLDSDSEEESSIEESSDSGSDDDGNETSTSHTSAQANVPQTLQEYVLVTDNKVVFQNNHEELAEIKTLEEFKKTTTSSALSTFPKNFEDFLLQYMNNTKSGENMDDVDMNCDSASNITCNDSKSQEPFNSTQKINRIHPTTALGDWDYAKELPKEIPADAPKDLIVKLSDEIRKISIITNTNYLDFEILRLVNHGDSIEGTKVIIGNPNFISELCKLPYQSGSVLMLDKGVMTSNIETSQPVVKDRIIGIERLSLMFPAVPKENLEELFDKCQKDINWTAGLLLDSGQVMSDLYSSTEAIECSSYEEDFQQLAHDPSNENGAILKSEIKKQKKRKNNDDISKYKEIQEKIQSNFVLGENHYSEKMKKHIERKHNIQIGSHSECSPSAPPEDEIDQTEEIASNEILTDGSDFEEDAVFMLDSDFIFQLQSRFGGLLRSNMIAEKTVVSLPSNLARQLHSYIMDSILQQIEGEDIFTDDSRMNKDEELARQLQDEELKARGVPSLLEIMDEEVALKCHGQVSQKDNNSGKSVANALSRQLLIERFPLMDPATLTTILEDTNHSLHEATSLLSSAGHFQAEPLQQQQVDQNGTRETTKATLSREEAIKQADAYGDVASKLYELRKDCLKKSQEAYRDGNSSVALYYSEMARWYMDRIEKSNSLAAKAILSGYEGWTTLDLHFLHVSEALNVLDLFVDEVIRGLQDSKEKKAVVYVITGRGLHSAGGRPRLKPAVQSRLTKRDIRFTEQNPGMLKITISRTALTSYNRKLAAACA